MFGNKKIKIVIAVFIVLILGAGGFFWWQEYQKKLWGPTQWSGKKDYLVQETSKGKMIRNQKIGLNFVIPEGWIMEEDETGLENVEYSITLFSPDAKFNENKLLTNGCIISEEVFYDIASFKNTNAEISVLEEGPKESQAQSVIINKEVIKVGGRNGSKITYKPTTLEGLRKIGELVEIKIPFNNNGIIHLGTTFLPDYREKCSQEFNKFLETVSID